MHILVVGGAGYIGSVTVDQLVDAGHDVTVLDSLVAGHKGALNPGSEFVQADVRDEEELNRVFASHNFDAVINYGGVLHAPRAGRHPRGRLPANNAGGGLPFDHLRGPRGEGDVVWAWPGGVGGARASP